MSEKLGRDTGRRRRVLARSVEEALLHVDLRIRMLTGLGGLFRSVTRMRVSYARFYYAYVRMRMRMRVRAFKYIYIIIIYIIY